MQLILRRNAYPNHSLWSQERLSHMGRRDETGVVICDAATHNQSVNFDKSITQDRFRVNLTVVVARLQRNNLQRYAATGTDRRKLCSVRPA